MEKIFVENEKITRLERYFDKKDRLFIQVFFGCGKLFIVKMKKNKKISNLKKFLYTLKNITQVLLNDTNDNKYRLFIQANRGKIQIEIHFNNHELFKLNKQEMRDIYTQLTKQLVKAIGFGNDIYYVPLQESEQSVIQPVQSIQQQEPVIQPVQSIQQQEPVIQPVIYPVQSIQQNNNTFEPKNHSPLLMCKYASENTSEIASV